MDRPEPDEDPRVSELEARFVAAREAWFRDKDAKARQAQEQQDH